MKRWKVIIALFIAALAASCTMGAPAMAVLLN